MMWETYEKIVLLVQLLICFVFSTTLARVFSMSSTRNAGRLPSLMFRSAQVPD